MKDELDSTQICSFVCIAWANWRMSNAVVHGADKQSIQACRAYYERERSSCQIRLLAKGILPFQQIPNEARLHQSHEEEGYPFTCFVDGSWSQGGLVGIGVYLMHRGTVVSWISKSIHSISSAQAEAKAVVEGYKMLFKKAQG